ncbi:uncharacterized protein MYCFIDRAFT_76458 [Pseudocercospora fijiensis CIRAD86]|uniref:USP domain-containing protein n=1 Tax=Pseudocercospora fijiensis (strain CIRAD86) TaxID=383855 RepID=N1QAU7_PSEFD|nr:uncharacterized protein MYCFIDRAFT_76458 [Pseudocercospora fijiensis CIRAD86]EME89091.1 hypothetical protein MYCFIDRAFT_76458 [Pseudocercospora fijiensis CIRAD86]
MPSKSKLGARAVSAAKKSFKRVADKFARPKYVDKEEFDDEEEDQSTFARPETRLAAKRLKELDSEISIVTDLLGKADRSYTTAQKKHNESQHKQRLTLFQQAQADRKLKDHKEAVAGHNARLQELDKKRKVQQARLDQLMKLEPQPDTTAKVQSSAPKRGGGKDRLRQLSALPAKSQQESDVKRSAPATGEKRKIVIDEDEAHAHKKQRVTSAPEVRKAPGSAHHRRVQQQTTASKNDISEKLSTTPRDASVDSGVSLPRKSKPACQGAASTNEQPLVKTKSEVATSSHTAPMNKKQFVSAISAQVSKSKAAPKATMKRKRDDDVRVDFDGDGYDEQSEASESIPTKRRKVLSDSSAIGLSNFGNACFSNVAIQLLNLALDDEDLKALHKQEATADDFGVDLETAKDFDGLPDSREQLDLVLAQLRKSIQQKAKQGKISITPYIRELLEDMRKSTEEHISPVLAQQAFAHHKTAFKAFDGEAMQDACEYLQLLLDSLFEECPSIREVFQFEVKITLKCSTCGHSETAGAHKEVMLKVRAPSSDAFSLEDVLSQYQQAKSDGLKTCGKCNATATMQAINEIDAKKMPANLLVEINRVQDDMSTNKSRLQLDGRSLVVGGTVYQIKAVVKHDCREATSGHYFLWRQCKGAWLKIDDELVTGKKRDTDMADGVGRKAAYTSMVLLKRTDIDL